VIIQPASQSINRITDWYLSTVPSTWAQQRITMLVGAWNQSAFITAGGSAFTWGDNRQGQLGHASRIWYITIIIIIIECHCMQTADIRYSSTH
jgi:hypothetical protein